MDRRLKKAELFLKWFEPMWLALTDAERRILETYKYSDIRSGMVGEIAGEVNYSARHLRRTRQKALARLEKLLYGD
jgi:DNA-directed RNA polymerase specialized sigma subunit